MLPISSYLYLISQHIHAIINNQLVTQQALQMKILDYNDTHLLLSQSNININIPSICKTYLLKSPSLSIISQWNGYYEFGSLQYATGIAALGTAATVKIYDFVYKRKLMEIDTMLPLVGLRIVKNLVFCVALERILIYDIATGSNLCHIPTSNGKLAAISNSYYSLKLLYPAPDPYSQTSSIFTPSTQSPSLISPSPGFTSRVFHEQEIWANKMKKIQCNTACSILQYDRASDILCLGHDNVIGLYLKEEIVRGCEFGGKIVWLKCSKTVDGKFYVLVSAEDQSQQQSDSKTKQQIKENKQQISKQNHINNLTLVAVTLAHKQYLKPELLQIYTPQLISPQPLFFEHSNTIHIWYGTSVYTTTIDNEPILNKNYKQDSNSNSNSNENKEKLSQIKNQNQNQNIDDSNIMLKQELLLKVSDIDILVKSSTSEKREEQYLKQIEKQLEEKEREQLEQQQKINNKKTQENQNKQSIKQMQQSKHDKDNSDLDNIKQIKQEDKRVYKGFRQSMQMQEINQDQIFKFSEQRNQIQKNKQKNEQIKQKIFTKKSQNSKQNTQQQNNQSNRENNNNNDNKKQ